MSDSVKAKRRLLLADDSVTIQKVVNLTFADADIEVTAVSDGDAAMRKFAEIVPDLVMVDVNMPGADGYQICEAIKQDEETKHIPVILLVGSFEPFDEALARRVGADDFLTKPFQSIRLLVNKVSDLLEERPTETNLPAPVSLTPASAETFDELLDNEADEDFDSADASIENLGEAGMDDEMIQTARLVGQTEEIDEYESEPIIDAEPAGKAELPPLKQSYDYRKPLQNLDDEEDWAKTQPLSKKDLEEIEAITDDAADGKAEPLLNLDDLDLLEFPQITPKVESEEIVLNTDSEISDEAPNAGGNAAEVTERKDESVESISEAQKIPPELVETIAAKVFEKISREMIEKVVREVVAQMENKE